VPQFYDPCMSSHTDFYSTAATIIPIFFLALAVQNRELLSQKITERQVASDVLFGAGVFIGFLTVSEAAALAGLLGLESSISIALIIFGIGLVIQLMAFLAIRGRPGKLLEELRKDEALWANAKERRSVYNDIWWTRIFIFLPAVITITGIALVLSFDIK
jgi:hypothetical protein